MSTPLPLASSARITLSPSLSLFPSLTLSARPFNMSGFSLRYGRSEVSVAEPLIPHRRRKGLCLAAASAVAVALVTVAALCVSQGVPFGDAWLMRLRSQKRFLQPEDIAAACGSIASFPELCMSSLSSYEGRKKIKHNLAVAGIAKLATREALMSVRHSHSISLYLEGRIAAEDLNGKAVLRDCSELLESSQDQLKRALHDVKHLKQHFSKADVDDIRTWLSAAFSFHTTCTDELNTIQDSSALLLVKQGEYTEKLISNALAFAASLSVSADGVEPNISDDSDDWLFPLVHRGTLSIRDSRVPSSLEDFRNLFPSWLSAKDAEYLQAISPTPNVIVALDGSGKYKTVQAAVDAAPQKSSARYVIYIKKGVYNEQVIIPKSATNLMFIGDGIGATIITGNRNVQQSGVTTFTSATVAVNGNGFLGRDITFRNTAGAVNHQAVALRVSADQAAFYRCSMEAYQDTLYVHTLRQFYRECTVYGTVDYIFGDSVTVFQSSTLLARVPMSGQKNTITAQGRTDPNANTGLSFHSCTVDGTPDLQKAISKYPTYLGRPWKEFSRTVFLKCYEGSVINAEGWLPWDGDFALKTLYYGEYLCNGPGAGASKRVSWSTQITSASEANKYTVANFIGGTQWLPSTSFPFQANL